MNSKSMAGWIGFAGILMLIIGGIDFSRAWSHCSRTNTSSSPHLASSSST